ncbi:MAG: class I SAM-dependent methyltransferase [Candidatus Saccharimonadales bacterium]
MKDKKILRETLRSKGQFWTPEWVADAMVSYIYTPSKDEVFDPGTGKGIFYTSLKKIDKTKKFYGTDIDEEIINKAKEEKIYDKNSKIEIRDFILNPPTKKFSAIVANPPYIRHHSLTSEQKREFKSISLKAIGSTLDGRAGLHIYFLIQALGLLEKGGRLAYIMPADTCEGVFAKKLWAWITKEFCLEGVITFDSKATPFPGVDTNAIIFLIKNDKPLLNIKWIKVLEESNSLFKYVKSGFTDKKPDLLVYDRDLGEALTTGLSRSQRKVNKSDFILSDFATVMRGIATGSNEFFFLTSIQAEGLGIPDNFLISAVGRTRDTEGELLTHNSLDALERRGRPTRLFFPNGHLLEDMPMTVRKYIAEGEKQGLPQKALISTRSPWYKMEVRKIPSFFFAYLGRRNARFIKNEAGAVPLTGFLCIYPHSEEKEYIEKLWQVLQDPDTVNNLKWVGKSYGGGAIKVEPRSLENLPINSGIVERAGLRPLKVKQLSLA